MSNFLHSNKTRAVLIILGACVFLLVVFGLGVAIGYRHAIFASNFGQNYYHNFYGGPAGGSVPGLMGAPPMNEHGIVGTVLDVSSSSVSVKDPNNNEQSVAVGDDTVIREMNNTIMIGAIVPGDEITAIGEPNEQGQIEARFIRVYAESQ